MKVTVNNRRKTSSTGANNSYFTSDGGWKSETGDRDRSHWVRIKQHRYGCKI